MWMSMKKYLKIALFVCFFVAGTGYAMEDCEDSLLDLCGQSLMNIVQDFIEKPEQEKLFRMIVNLIDNRRGTKAIRDKAIVNGLFYRNATGVLKLNPEASVDVLKDIIESLEKCSIKSSATKSMYWESSYEDSCGYPPPPC